MDRSRVVMPWVVLAFCAPLILTATIAPLVVFGMWLERQR